MHLDCTDRYEFGKHRSFKFKIFTIDADFNHFYDNLYTLSGIVFFQIKCFHP